MDGDEEEGTDDRGEEPDLKNVDLSLTITFQYKIIFFFLLNFS